MFIATRSAYSPRMGVQRHFQYQPLDLELDSVRLLRVLPSRSDEGGLRLAIWHTTLPTKYHCVSYEWGSLPHQHTVLVNGRDLSVGANLHGFLEEVHQWAQRGFDDPLWIDAICIDQSNVAERGHQVQRMGTIYSEALDVFVWLGDHGDLNSAFQDWLHTAHEQPCPSSLRQQWDLIRYNTYWQRAWIKQEILLAKTITVVLRRARVDWLLLGCAIAKSGDLNQLDDEHAAHLWTFWGERWRSQTEDHGVGNARKDLFSFWSLMHMHSRAGCTDKRDRVYSLLGLIEKDHGFAVDYNEDIADLFWRVSEYFEIGDSPELVDILKTALLDEKSDTPMDGGKRPVPKPWNLARSLLRFPDRHIRIPVRRATTTDSIMSRIRKSAKCNFTSCAEAPRLKCARDDILLCTNTKSEDPSDHGCIHAIAHPLDKPAAEPFEIRLVAHHRKQTATTKLRPTAVKYLDSGTNQWIGVSTWSSLQKALIGASLDRDDRVKLSVPAIYAMMIWFGIHPGQLDDESFVDDSGLPSAHHALPRGTKISRDSIELPVA